MEKRAHALSSLICVYVTCKTEELRISIDHFLATVEKMPDTDQNADVLLSYELLLVEKLDFHLVVHTAYRPFEGLIIDLKVRPFFFVSTRILGYASTTTTF